MVDKALQPHGGSARTWLGMALVTVLALGFSTRPDTSHAAAAQFLIRAVPPASSDLPSTEEADSDEPFGGPMSVITDGPLVGKWQAVQRSIRSERALLALCWFNPISCASPPAVAFLAIVQRAGQREGLARLGEINRAINLEIRPATDLELHQADDFWSSPLVTLALGAGDCEDYAIAKFVALREAGVPSGDLRLVILRDQQVQADHAVVAVRIDHRWRILDSRRLMMLDEADFLKFQGRLQFQPIFSISDVGISRYDDAPLLAAAIEPLRLSY